MYIWFMVDANLLSICMVQALQNSEEDTLRFTLSVSRIGHNLQNFDRLHVSVPVQTLGETSKFPTVG